MLNIKNYMRDGANYQAKCVLAILQHDDSLIEESWNNEISRYDANVEVGRWENCREQGYVVSMKNSKFDQINIAFFEHRNSDSISVVVWNQNTINTPNIDSMDTKGTVYKDKWDTTKDFVCEDFAAAAEFIKDALRRHWHKGIQN